MINDKLDMTQKKFAIKGLLHETYNAPIIANITNIIIMLFNIPNVDYLDDLLP